MRHKRLFSNLGKLSGEGFPTHLAVLFVDGRNARAPKSLPESNRAV
jgi:hypothetical protein